MEMYRLELEAKRLLPRYMNGEGAGTREKGIQAPQNVGKQLNLYVFSEPVDRLKNGSLMHR